MRSDNVFERRSWVSLRAMPLATLEVPEPPAPDSPPAPDTEPPPAGPDSPDPEPEPAEPEPRPEPPDETERLRYNSNRSHVG
jgi:hypothetical protein